MGEGLDDWAFLITRRVHDQAIADYTEAIRINQLESALDQDHPGDALAYYSRGLAYGEKGDESKSKADFSKAKELGYEGG